MQDEVAALDHQIEERHAAELAALEQRDSSSKQESEDTDAPVKPIIQGLYEVRLAPQEPPQVTLQPCTAPATECSHELNLAPKQCLGR